MARFRFKKGTFSHLLFRWCCVKDMTLLFNQWRVLISFGSRGERDRFFRQLIPVFSSSPPLLPLLPLPLFLHWGTGQDISQSNRRIRVIGHHFISRGKKGASKMWVTKFTKKIWGFLRLYNLEAKIFEETMAVFSSLSIDFPPFGGIGSPFSSK